MRVISILVIATLLLAGCSDNSTSNGDKNSSSSTTSSGPPPPPPVTTDTLHLMAVPDMVTVLPEGGAEISSVSPSGNFGGGGGGGGGQSQPPEWTYLITSDSNVTVGEIHIWIKITETLVQSPPVFPGQSACTWFVRLELGIDNFIPVPCLAEPAGPISPATKELVFNFVAEGATQLELNETVAVSFRRSAFSPSANPSVFVLSGTAEHDSYVKLTGLKEVVKKA